MKNSKILFFGATAFPALQLIWTALWLLNLIPFIAWIVLLTVNIILTIEYSLRYRLTAKIEHIGG